MKGDIYITGSLNNMCVCNDEARVREYDSRSLTFDRYNTRKLSACKSSSRYTDHTGDNLLYNLDEFLLKF
jgi:hypothetical protein